MIANPSQLPWQLPGLSGCSCSPSLLGQSSEHPETVEGVLGQGVRWNELSGPSQFQSHSDFWLLCAAEVAEPWQSCPGAPSTSLEQAAQGGPNSLLP